MNILMTGGSGFLGMALAKSLMGQGHTLTVLTRNKQKTEAKLGTAVNTCGHLEQINPDAHFDAMINLAGEPIFGARWRPARKKLLRESRIGLTRQLVTAIARMKTKPLVLISGSAIGYYGCRGDQVLTEQSSPAQSDFSQQLCADWESAALDAEQFGVRVCLVRTGLVLGAGGGLLERMLRPFKWGLGGRLGDGNQWMSWIHIKDWVACVESLLLDNKLSGAFNATAPNPVTNTEFTQTLANKLKRPTLLPLSSTLLTKLLGEMSALVLDSQRVKPERLLNVGFTFYYPTLSEALDDCLKGLKDRA